MKVLFLILPLFLASCHQAEHRPELPQGTQLTAEARFAFEQILREIDAGKTPVGRLDPAPRTTEEALAGLSGLGLGATNGDRLSVSAHDGFLICSWGPLDRPGWGQRGYAVDSQTGDVYEWSLW